LSDRQEHVMSISRRIYTLALSCVLATPAAFAQIAPAPEGATGRTTKTYGYAGQYMVAAANPLATEAGREILRAGGSAVDAAIAVQLVLNLVEPQSSGIGGGAFLMHRTAQDGKLTTLDGRETAPSAAKPDRFIGADGKSLAYMNAVVSGRSIGVPGTVRMRGGVCHLATSQWPARPRTASAQRPGGACLFL
jgi:gamma-glutamyltranspeptidase / glutathione hydrolase